MLVVAHLPAVTAALVNAAEGPRRGSRIRRRRPARKPKPVSFEESSIWQPAPDIYGAKATSNNNLTFIHNLRQPN